MRLARSSAYLSRTASGSNEGVSSDGVMERFPPECWTSSNHASCRRRDTQVSAHAVHARVDELERHTARVDGTIRRLTRPELDTMVDWAAGEGWNPGVHDADAFVAADPDGFFGLDVDGELAVTLAVVRYDDRFAFMGFYICRPELRGRGFGLELFEAGLAHGGVTTLGLDGVVEQEPNYARDGFVTAHHSVRFGGRPDLALTI